MSELNTEMNISKNIEFILKNKLKIILFSVKSLTFILLIISAFYETLDYISFPYNYKLIVSDRTQQEIPAISFCTKNNVIFDRNKINQFFKISHEFEKWVNITKIIFKNKFYYCLKLAEDRKDCLILYYWQKYKINSLYEDFKNDYKNLNFSLFK